MYDKIHYNLKKKSALVTLPGVSVGESHSDMSDSLRPHRLYSPWNPPGQNTGVGNHSLLQGAFPTQRSNRGLLHCRWILYSLSHQGSPRIQEWEAYPFSRGSSQPRNQTRVSCIAGRFFTSWATREALPWNNISVKVASTCLTCVPLLCFIIWGFNFKGRRTAFPSAKDSHVSFRRGWQFKAIYMCVYMCVCVCVYWGIAAL